ncbi:hypothetical protein ABEB36_012789 [Hypothenemus hampei]|uniref:Uncharacterized protein n=1 Tax=Hypothenemus hampei TaxID=57062 RepID=A0ABD1E6P4_HYPHA
MNRAEQFLKDAIRKTGANPDYDQTQKKAHFPSAYEGTRTTSMSLRCEILTTRGKVSFGTRGVKWGAEWGKQPTRRVHDNYVDE